ncbi:hypothetical protein ABZW03_09680 [Kitasatospora sp. NPDC004799]|uniref:hypothetical protein n=1 Tax=Kitasatospora sp. NPDC004799 TaxID=3154460 RepID=UPI0033BE8900
MAPERRPAELARRAWTTAWTTNRPLAGTAVLMAVMLAIALVGLIADPRSITGQPAWAKPARFALSITVYALTLLWLLTFVRGHDRLVRVVSRVTAVSLVVEMGLIAAAAASGTTSHFNFGTATSTAVWMTMAAFIAAAWAMAVATVVLLLRQRVQPPVFAWGLRLGMAMSALGMALGFLMTTPTSEQLAAARRGEGMPIVGGHTVGLADGGPGLPVTDWSTHGGDLRIPHFAGLHALQVLPLIGFLLATGLPGVPERHRVALMWTAALAYLGLVLLLLAQALRGQPVTDPDAVTVTVLLALAAATGAAVLAVLRRARGPQSR